MHIIAVEISSEPMVSPEVGLPWGHTCLSRRGLERALTDTVPACHWTGKPSTLSEEEDTGTCAALTGNILSRSSFHPKLQNTPKHTTKSVPLGKLAVCSPAFPQPSQVPSHPLTPASRGTRLSSAWKENSEGCST